METKIARSVFQVKEKRYLTPYYLRVVFAMTDSQVEQFSNVIVGKNNKIFIPAAGITHIDSDDESIWDAGLFIARRTYTTRRIDVIKKEMWVDFVVHADSGPAAAWAHEATEGSWLGIAMKEGIKPLFPPADEYLLVGDSTAIPVISVILEQLPADAKAKVFLEVYDKNGEIELPSNAAYDIEWVHNPHPEAGSPLAGVVRNSALPQGKRFVFIAAEYSTVQDLRSYLKEGAGCLPEEYSASAYWKSGVSEEQSAAQRREERR